MAGHLVRKYFSSKPKGSIFKLMTYWPPLIGAGIKVTDATEDNMYLRVEMPLKWYNRNFVGTHFGGSLYSMTDPFYMLQLMAHLGKGYIVWDKAAYIDFKSPGKGTVYAEFSWTQTEVDEIKKNADGNEKYIFDKDVTVYDLNNKIVAEVKKTLYVKKK